jgi:small subunit ribosomal protein S24e
MGIEMKVEIVDKVENPLLKRAELKFRVDHAGAPTPKRLEVRPQLAALLGVAEDLVVIDKFSSTHGRQVASGIARTYVSKEQLEKIEPKYLLKRGLPKEAKQEKPAEEKPKEAKPEKGPAKEAKHEEKTGEK